jgi:hypothetical protein
VPRKRSTESRTPEGEPMTLIDWREPERNTHVLDWYERAHEFGLLPVVESDAIEAPIVAPPERFLREEEPEAAEDQPIDDVERDAPAEDEIEESPERVCRKLKSTWFACTSSTSASGSC